MATSSRVSGNLTVDPSLIVPGAAAPVVTINNSGVGVSNYPMHWPTTPTTAYIDVAVPFNMGNPSPLNVVYNGTTYTPTPGSVIISGTGAAVVVNLTLP
jgi:hypothetical protein